MAAVTFGIAIALLVVATARLALAGSTWLAILGSLVVLVAAVWLLGLGLQLGRVGEHARRARAIEREVELERRLALERVRRLTESSFVAGSNALLRVRAVLRTLQDCRQRLGTDQNPVTDTQKSPSPSPSPTSTVNAGASNRPSPSNLPNLASQSNSPSPPAGGPNSSVPPLSVDGVDGVFDSILGDVGRLADCARSLQPLADAAETAAGAAGSTGGSALARALSREPRLPDGRLLMAALKLRGLAAELEHGLLGLSAEMRVLKRARLARPSVNGVGGARRSGAEPSLTRVLERLEAQMVEAVDHVTGLTRDAEQLSRELDRLR
jgi:hypothetical protein